jgi:IclR family transcriptional regulator, acetate operon repressor
VNTVKSLMKGLQALDLVRASVQPVRTIDIAERLEIDKGAASRTLQTLVQAGYANRTQDRRYVPGEKLRPEQPPQLVGVVRLRERAHALLRELADFAGECAHLAILAGDRVLYLDKIESPQSLRVDQPIGTLAPLHCTALGKVFLAFAGAPIPPRPEHYTPRTITDPQLLAAHVRSIAQQGYSVDDEEFALGVRCVAAPLRDESGRVVGAIGVSGPTARVSLERLAEMGARVRLVADGYGRETEG